MARRNPKPVWSKIDKNGPINDWRPELGPCWIWMGKLSVHGYGPYRIVWVDAERQIERKRRIREGDWPAPKVGDRIWTAQQRGNSKLTEQDVRDIRAAHAAGEYAKEIAKRYAVNEVSIGNIVNGITWRHVA